MHHYGYTGVFIILMLEMIGIPFPAETTLTVAGLGLMNGTFAFIPLLIAATLANVAGSSIAYWIGRRFGVKAVLKYGKFVGLTQSRLDKAEVKLNRYRIPVILLSKFVAGIRVFVPYLAGINKLPFKSFTFYNTIAAMIWVTVFTLLGRWIHVAWRKFHAYLHGGMLLLIAGLILTVIIAVLISKTKKIRSKT